MDFSEVNVICRLCLKKITENSEPIGEIIQHSLNFLTLCPNLTISDDPMICETCAVNLKKCFDFKARCLSTEDSVASFADSENKKVNLRDIYSKVQLDGNIDRIPDDHSVCRFCLGLVKDDTSTSVLHDVDLITILQKYFLEMDLGITDDVIACTPCYDSLRFHVSFVNNHLSIEGKINEYCKVEGANYKDQVNLRDVVTFTSKSMLDVENICSRFVKENNDENLVNTDVDVKVKFEDPTEEEQEMDKLVDNKKQQNNNSFQHHSSPPQSDSVPQLSRANQVKYKCVLCDYKTKWRPDLRRHMLTHKTPSEITMYKCDECPFETKRKDGLQRHSLTHMDRSKVQMHKCEMCPLETKWKGNLQAHLLSHTNTLEVVTSSTMYKCDLCSHKTKRKANLRRHMLTHSDTTMYKCDLCDYEAKRKSHLEGHLLTHENHSGITVYKCGVCAYVTRQKHHLQQHMLTHMDESKIEMHECKVCRFKTKWKKNLQKHMLSHRSTSDVVIRGTMYKCDLCDYEAKQELNLEKHMLTHKTHSGMYKCNLCDYEPKRKFDLKRHLLTHKSHSKITKYKCDLCPFVSKYKRYFQKHEHFHKNTPDVVT